MNRLTVVPFRVLQVVGLVVPLLFVSAPLANADNIGKLEYLGTGGCRTAQGGQGTFRLERNVSLSECKQLCDGKAPCAAVEYNQHKRECEVHSEPITRVSAPGAGETTCYQFR